MSCYVQNSTELDIIAPDLELLSEFGMCCFKCGGPGKIGSRDAERAASKGRYWEVDKDISCFPDELMHEWSVGSLDSPFHR